ncbi:MAG: tetratricopeptide repeat protein, partial [Pirellulales bacterium]
MAARLAATATLLLMVGVFFAARKRGANDGFEEIRGALKQFDGQRALALLAQADDGPTSRAAKAYLSAIAQRQQADVPGALESLRRARRYGYDRRAVERQEKLLAFQSGDIDRTAPYLLNWLAASPSDDDAAQIYDCMTKGYLAAVRLDEAAYCIDLWLRWKPNDVRPLWLRAELERARHDDSQATATYRAILRLTPDDAKAHRELGRLLIENNDAAAALEHLQRYHIEHPDDHEATIYLARCQRSMGVARLARSLLDEVLRETLAPRLRADALVELGQLQLKEEAPDNAANTLRQAVELAPANAAAHYALALALTRLGDQAQADRHFSASDRIAAQDERLADLAAEII